MRDEDENEDETEDDLDLSECDQCGEFAWDGYICHECGMKTYD